MKKLLTFLFAVGVVLVASSPILIDKALGAFNSTGGGTYFLKSSLSSTQNTIVLSTFTEPVSGLPYTMTYINTTIGYGTINPESSNSEFVSFTGITQNANGSATLTGVIRGLSRTPGTGGCVASSTLAQPFPGQTRFILSAPPCFYSQYPAKANDETITGQWTFTTFPITPGSPQASETAAGISQLATGAQAGASTLTGSSGSRLVLSTKISSSTYASNASAVIPVTNSLNHIDAGFVSSSTNFSVATRFDAPTTTAYIGSFPAWQIGLFGQYFTTPGTTTFSVPSGITRVHVMTIGAGGGGGGGTNGTSGWGGSAGGCAIENVDVTGTSTIQVFVGSGGTGGTGAAGSTGTWSTFGTNGFYNSATPGQGGPVSFTANGDTTAAGIGVNAELNISGQPGMPGAFMPTGGNVFSGTGGSSCMGGGGQAYDATTNNGTQFTGGTGGNYGGGGGGGATHGSTSSGPGGPGAGGAVIVTW